VQVGLAGFARRLGLLPLRYRRGQRGSCGCYAGTTDVEPEVAALAHAVP